MAAADHNPKGGAGWRRATRRHAPWLLIVALVPLAFHFQLIVRNYEPPAPDTQAVSPLLEWARDAEARLGTVPMWCPVIFSGMPSYGSFLYAPASWNRPFDMLVQLFRGSRGIRYYLAMLLGGISLYVLGLRFGLSPLAATVGSLLFVLTPYMAGVIQAGHSTKLRALYHAPLVLLAVERGLRRPGIGAAALLAFSVALLGWTRHPQIAYYTLFLLALYAAARLIFVRPPAWSGRGWITGAVLLVVAVALAGGMLADPLASVREYTPHSVRGSPGVFTEAEDVSGGTPWDYATAWSAHPEELLSFLSPEWFGLEGATYWGRMPFTQSTHYFGVVALALGVLALLWARNRTVWIWAGLSLVVVVIGFGRFVPVLYRPMFELLPFFNKFRVPSMIYSFLPLMILPLAGRTLCFVESEAFPVPAGPEGKKAGKGKARRRRPAGSSPGRWIFAATVVLAVVLVVWVASGPSLTRSMAGSPTSGGGFFVRGDDAARYGQQNIPVLIQRRAELFHAGMARTLFLLMLLGTVLELRRRRILTGFWAAALIGLLAIGDVWVVGKRFQRLEPKATLEQARQPDESLRYLASVPGPFRFVPLDDTGSNRHAALGLQSIMGYQPAKLRAYQDLIDGGCLASQGVLDMLQTRFLVSGQELTLPGYRRVHLSGRGTYERTEELPRAWLVGSLRTLADDKEILGALKSPGFRPREVAFARSDEGLVAGEKSGGAVTLRSWSEHAIDLAVEVGPDGNGLLVLSEMRYPPGWRALIDGADAEIHRINHVLMGVEVSPGAHDVRFEVRPGVRATALPVSQAATVVTVLLLIGGWVLQARRRARAAAGSPDARPESESSS